MVSLETAIGNTIELGDNIVYPQIEMAVSKFPVVTANLASNVFSGYVAFQIPENIVQLLLDMVVGGEQELAFAYVSEIEDWNKKQQDALDEYNLDQQIVEEEARKAPLEFIFDALERKGKPVSPFRTQYAQTGHLTELRRGQFLKLLSNAGVDDEYVLEDVNAIIGSRELIDEDRTWQFLVEHLGVKAPTLQELAPAVEFKEVAPLPYELADVVSAAYLGRSLDNVTVTRSAWEKAGVEPSEAYEKVAAAVRPINRLYAIVKVLGQSEEPGSLELAAHSGKGSLKQGTPKGLRSYLRPPAELVEDAYTFSTILLDVMANVASDWLDEMPDEKGDSSGKLRTYFWLEELVDGHSELARMSFFRSLIYEPDGNARRNYSAQAARVRQAVESGRAELRDNIVYQGAGRKILASRLVETLRHIGGIVLEEMFRLKRIKSFVDSTQRELSEFEKAKQQGYRPGLMQLQSVKTAYGLMDVKKSDYVSLIEKLGPLADGVGGWTINKEMKDAFGRMEFYALVEQSPKN